MADKLKVEVHEKDVTIPENLKNDLTKFKGEIERKAKEVQQQKTLAEAQKLMDGAQVSVDYKDMALQIGDVVLKFETRKDLDDTIAAIEADLNKINAELQSAELDMRRAKDQVIAESKDATNAVNPTKELFDKLQQIVNQNKEFDQSLQDFLKTNDAEDIAKLLELYDKLKKAKISNEAGIASVLTAGTIAALEEQNAYLQKIVAGYEKEGAKFDIKKFKEKNQKHISKDLSAFAKQFGVDLPVTEQPTPSQVEKSPTQGVEKQAQGIEWSSDGVPTFTTFEAFQQFAAGQVEDTEDKPEEVYTKREKTMVRLSEKLENQKTEEGKLRIAKRMAKVAESKRKLEEKTQKAAAKAGAETIVAHEMKNQTWYYKDIIANITKKNARTKYTGDMIIIDTYNPLFAMNGLNEKGTIRIKCNPNDPNSVVANALHFAQGQDEFLTKYPECKNATGDMKGLNQLLTETLGNKTNMKPGQVEFWNGALKLGTVIGLGYTGFQVLKGIFGKEGTKVFGREKKKGEGWAWLGGAVGSTLLMQSVTGKDPMTFAYQLFNGGLDSKDFAKIPRLKDVAKKLKVNPEFNDYMKNGTGMMLLFPGATFGDVVKNGNIITWNGDKPTISKQGLAAYYQSKLADKLLPQNMREQYMIALKNVTSMNDDQLNELVTKGMNQMGVTGKSAAEKISDASEALKKQMEAQAEAAKEIKHPVINSLRKPYITAETSALLAANNMKELTDAEASSLQLALIELQTKDPSAELLFTPEYGLILRTKGGDIPMKLATDGKWQVAGFDKALFVEPMQAMRVAALTTFLINSFKGRFENTAAPWKLNNGDITFADNNSLKGVTGRMRNNMTGIFSGLRSLVAGETEVVDGADWKFVPWAKSSIKELGGQAFEANIGAYVDYLNSLKKGGKSIWDKKADLVRSTEIDGFIPKWKPAKVEDKAVPSNDKNPDQPVDKPAIVPASNDKTPDSQQNNKEEKSPNAAEDPNNKDKKEKTAEEKEQEIINEMVDKKEVARLAALFKQWSGGKDGGLDVSGTEKYDMPDSFFTVWATNYIIYGEAGAGKETFTYNYESADKKVKKALVYQRQIGRKAPIRVDEKDGAKY